VIIGMNEPTHFERLGLPRRFALDPREIESCYLVRSRALHPDFHQLASSGEQQASLQLSAELNEAYAVLRDPFRRAEYLLELAGGPAAHDVNEMAPEFLEEILELRMALAEADDEAEHAKLEKQLRERQARMIQEIANDFAALEGGADRESTLRSIRQRLNALKYIQNLLRRR
jgi:molecular chaperone HscB